MRKNVLTFGIILGTILCVNMIVMVNLCYTSPDMKRNDIVGYAALVLIFSLIFFGIRNYRDKQLNGIISFGKAFKTGAIIALISSTMYVIVWLFYYYLLVPDFLEHYIPLVLKNVSQTELPAKKIEMANFKEMYKNPFFVVLITYAEVLPIGLVVTIISSLLLKCKIKQS